MVFEYNEPNIQIILVRMQEDSKTFFGDWAVLNSAIKAASN